MSYLRAEEFGLQLLDGARALAQVTHDVGVGKRRLSLQIKEQSQRCYLENSEFTDCMYCVNVAPKAELQRLRLKIAG